MKIIPLSNATDLQFVAESIGRQLGCDTLDDFIESLNQNNPDAETLATIRRGGFTEDDLPIFERVIANPTALADHLAQWRNSEWEIDFPHEKAVKPQAA